MTDDSPFFPMRLRLAVAQAMTDPGQPLPVSGFGTTPSGETVPVMGRIDLQANTFELHASVLGKPQSKPRGARHKDGKRIGVLMLHNWLTTVGKSNEGEAYKAIAEIMRFGGTDESKIRSVKKTLHTDPRATAIAKEIKGRQVLCVIAPAGAAGLWFMPDHHLSTYPTDGVAVSGWLLSTEAPEAAVYAEHRFTMQDIPEGDYASVSHTTTKGPKKG